MATQSYANPDLSQQQARWFKWLQFLLIALLASTAFLTGDGPAVSEGMTSWSVMSFAILGSLWGVFHLRFPSVRYRMDWSSFLLCLTVLAMLVSVISHFGAGDFRAGLNSWWQWVAFAVGFMLCLQLFNSPLVIRAVVAVMLAIAVSISSIGIYDSLVHIPQVRAEYFQGNDQQRVTMLREAGISDTRIGSPSRYHFESRIQSPEPHVTFALTNSLAGFLAPWFTVLLFTLLNQKQSPHGKAEFLKFLGLACIVAFCLILTKSRAACCAIGLSVLVGGVLLKGYRSVVLKAGGLLAAIGVIVFVLGIATQRLDSKILTEAVKSLSFRMEYWESSTEMAVDHLWTGVGPGNFRDHYTFYKQVGASESIADPHNWLLEVLTSFGLPVLVLLCLAIGVALLRVLNSEPSYEELAYEERGTQGPRLSANQIYLAGGIGCAFGLAVDQLNYALIPLSVFYVALPGFAIVIFLLQDWVERGQLHPHHLLLAFVCWAINLSVAGGITYPGVAYTGWLLLGLSLLSRSNKNLSGVESQNLDQRVLSQRQRWIMMVFMGALPIAAYVTFHRPVTTVDYQLLHANYDLSQNKITGAREHLQEAINADPTNTDAYLRHANVLFMLLSEERSTPLYDEYRKLVDQALALNPNSQTSYELFSQQALLLYDRFKQPEDLSRALEFVKRESELYPTNAYIFARMSICQYFQGDWKASLLAQEKAFSLDDENPHLEFKLSNRRLCEVEFAGWKDQKIFFDKIDESVEQSLKSLRKRRQQ